ncbi:hypothetical protein [Oceanirhabdus sp. W0125-5]|uniref:hypothetical protein n=1 Tax=Oceanirhabdus sp. W0125-5 TaxID=2999116 RepID=UPI0022F2F21E|nr:hypothetical protein [Oceanirhabdus sp. W0125-5]WBW98980.1 hypothetical protein OW730_09600 [Oceanirhabdus sp. W0125-5]
MKKILLKLSGVSFFMGVLTILVTSFTNKLIPKIASIKFIGNLGSHSESNYIMDFKFENSIAAGLILMGVVGIVLCMIKKDKE